MNTITIAIDPRYPEQALEECGHQVELVMDLMSMQGDLALSARSRAALTEMLAAVVRTLDSVQGAVAPKHKTGLRTV